jgi:hypothetical protein
MTNPSGYVFPEINGSRPFERIRVEDRHKLAAFARREQPDWEIPTYQKVLNWISGLAFWLALIALFGHGIRLFRQKHRPLPGHESPFPT